MLLITGKDFNWMPHVPYLLMHLGNQARKSFSLEPFVHPDVVICHCPNHLVGEVPLPGLSF
jgi:hypothetical protein